MKTNTMMTTVSTAALFVGGGQAVFAQDGLLPEGYSLNVQGGYGIINNAFYDKIENENGGGSAAEDAADKFGDEDTFRQISGSASLSRELAPGRDIRFGFRGALTVEDEFSAQESSAGSTQTTRAINDFSFAAVDFDMGYRLPASGFDLRGFVGARALTSNSEFGLFGEAESGGTLVEAAEITLMSEFTGIGPRVGASFSTPATPVGTAGDFSLSGELAASYLFGKREDSVRAIFDDDPPAFLSETKDLEVTTLEAQIGINYHLSPNSKLSVGYELQQFWNVDLFSDGDDDRGSGDRADPRLIHGVFVGFATTF